MGQEIRALLFAGLALAIGLALPAEPARGQSNAAPAEPGVFEVLLRPVRDGGTEVTAIAVRATIRGGELAGDERLRLTAPVVYAGVPGIADRVEDLQVTDRHGIVPLSAEDGPAAPGGFPYFRHWTAGRDVSFPVRITYRSRVQPVGAPGGPPFGIRPTDGGVSGAGSGFLVIPENAGTTSSQVEWDLSDLQNGSLAATSFGDGDFSLDGPAARLMQGWYMAGPAGRFPADGDIENFSATWLGVPPWNPAITMAQTADIYGYLGEAFAYLGEAPRYRVFVRILETPPFGGGTALTDSFMLSRGPAGADDEDDDPQGLLFHEMIHGFVGGIEGPGGVTSWFSEGLTSYYTTQLQLRGGYWSLQDYIERINFVAEEYYTNPARNWSAERIVEVGFSDNFIRHLPYRRGELYFADLDSRLRAASGGARDLDTLIEAVFLRRKGGWTFDHDAWRSVLERELGPEAVAMFDAVVLDGTQTLAPAPDAFGPCLSREPAIYERGGETFQGYRWVRAGGVSDSECAGASNARHR
ncbi:MAG: hypothetical protein U9P68_00840 [Pseudomonadota bacterium]|nr:hypothetical protein [Pseudomonadota bacterium]